MNNFWNQFMTFNVWSSDYGKKYVIEVNLHKNKKRFLTMAKSLAGNGFMWELSTTQNPDESIVIL